MAIDEAGSKSIYLIYSTKTFGVTKSYNLGWSTKCGFLDLTEAVFGWVCKWEMFKTGWLGHWSVEPAEQLGAGWGWVRSSADGSFRSWRGGADMAVGGKQRTDAPTLKGDVTWHPLLDGGIERDLFALPPRRIHPPPLGLFLSSLVWSCLLLWEREASLLFIELVKASLYLLALG